MTRTITRSTRDELPRWKDRPTGEYLHSLLFKLLADQEGVIIEYTLEIDDDDSDSPNKEESGA